MDVKYFDHLVRRWCRVDMVVVNDNRFLDFFLDFFNIIIHVRESSSVFFNHNSCKQEPEHGICGSI